MTERIEKEMGGIPSTHPQSYISKSPYCFTDITQTAIKKYEYSNPILYGTRIKLENERVW